jgi:hypothetical protein
VICPDQELKGMSISVSYRNGSNREIYYSYLVFHPPFLEFETISPAVEIVGDELL